jgi:hypothetical protein
VRRKIRPVDLVALAVTDDREVGRQLDGGGVRCQELAGCFDPLKQVPRADELGRRSADVDATRDGWA